MYKCGLGGRGAVRCFFCEEWLIVKVAIEFSMGTVWEFWIWCREKDLNLHGVTPTST